MSTGLARRELLWCAAAGLPRLAAEPGLPRTRTAAVRCEVDVPGSPVSLWLPVPKSDACQTIDELRISGLDRHEIHDGPVDSNRYLFAKVPGSRTVGMEFRLARTERLPGTSSPVAGQPSPTCCTGPDRLVPLDARIRGWAQDVVQQARARTDLEKARAIYEHVVSTVKYDKSGQGWGRGDIYYACDTRRGNCSDFHAIFIGYARAVGIPAKFVIGLPLPPNRGSGAIAGYHCWAEFFTKDTGWVPVDASEAAKDPARRKYFFGALDEDRVELSQGRDLVLTPRQTGAPLNFFVYPYAESAGQRVDLSFRYTYQDLPPPASR
ncbi:MAG: transglutaminase domain-containing protein [Acidobacteria bacterium]|nr:transglutaminase domain-containing protein [Acidobacteriota bacterium]